MNTTIVCKDSKAAFAWAKSKALDLRSVQVCAFADQAEPGPGRIITLSADGKRAVSDVTRFGGLRAPKAAPSEGRKLKTPFTLGQIKSGFAESQCRMLKR